MALYHVSSMSLHTHIATCILKITHRFDSRPVIGDQPFTKVSSDWDDAYEAFTKYIKDQLGSLTVSPLMHNN